MSRKGENIYKRKDGRWEARYIKGYLPEGRARYGYCYGRTYQEAREKAVQARAALLQNQPLPGSVKKKRFAVCCDEWLRLKRTSVRESTYVKYETILEKHIKPALGGCFADTLTELLVEEFSYELLHEKELAPKTVRDILSLLRSVLCYAGKQYPSAASVTVTYPKENRKEMRVLTAQEQRSFTRYLLDGLDDCRFGVLLTLMTGLRIGELCALRWSDISLSLRVIYVRRTIQRLKNTDGAEQGKTRLAVTSPKSDSSARVIPLNSEIAELCRNRGAQNPDAYVLTGEGERCMEPRTLQYRMERYTKDCGLEGVHFHTLRHSFATRCVEAGFEIKSLSEILGHSSPRITLERYVHSSLELKRENMERLSLIG